MQPAANACLSLLKSLQDTDLQDGSEVCWWCNMGNCLVDMNLITSSSQMYFEIYSKVGFTHTNQYVWAFVVSKKICMLLQAVWTSMVCWNKAPPGPAWGDGVLGEGLVETWSSIVMLWHQIDSPGAPERTDGPSGYPNTKESKDDVTVLKHKYVMHMYREIFDWRLNNRSSPWAWPTSLHFSKNTMCYLSSCRFWTFWFLFYFRI